MTEAPVTTGDTYHTLYLTNEIHDIHPQTDTSGDTPTGTPHTICKGADMFVTNKGYPVTQ